MRMSNSGGGTPRKFSEKIAILERKQNEENTNFEDIMRQVRSITHEPGDSGPSTAPMQIPQGPASGGLLPPQQPWGHNLGGSLPNVHQMPSYSPPQWPPNWHNDVGHHHRQMNTHRSRSPDGHPTGSSPTSQHHHYHPYGAHRNPGRSPDRVPPLHPTYPYDPTIPNGYHNQPGQLVPPESWNQINRARSDPAIHNMRSIPPPPMFTPAGPAQHHHPHQQHQHQNGMSPVNNHMMNPMYSYQNGGVGSPMQSPLGSPHASSLMLDGGGGTPCMELSPPGMMHDGYDQQQQQTSSAMGSLPNVGGGGGGQIHPDVINTTSYYHHHPPIGPRHSTGTCGPRLAPGPMMTPDTSQSAPTSPHNQLDPNQQPAWPMRTFSNSPEALDIPKLVLTNPEGTPGQQVDCFNDLQDLTLNSTDLDMICNGTTSQMIQQQPPQYQPQHVQHHQQQQQQLQHQQMQHYQQQQPSDQQYQEMLQNS